jgi:hypothetical protein
LTYDDDGTWTDDSSKSHVVADDSERVLNRHVHELNLRSGCVMGACTHISDCIRWDDARPLSEIVYVHPSVLIQCGMIRFVAGSKVQMADSTGTSIVVAAVKLFTCLTGTDWGGAKKTRRSHIVVRMLIQR